MTQVLASVDFSEVITLAADSFALTFIDNAEYEFVGGGTAVNNL